MGICLLYQEGKCENPLPTLGRSTSAGEHSEKGRFFTSSSQALVITTPPPIIKATTAISVSKSSSIASSSVIAASKVSSPSDGSSLAKSESIEMPTEKSNREDRENVSEETLEEIKDTRIIWSLSGDEQEETTTEPASEPDQSILMPSSSNSIPISVSSSQVLEPSILDMNEVDGSVSTSSTAKIFTKMSTTSEPMISETSLNPGNNPGNIPGNPGISSSSNQSRSLISTSTIAATSGDSGSEAIISTTKTEQSFLGLKVSNIGVASRPYDLPRVAPGNIIIASKKINVVNEPSAISILDKSGQDLTTSNKKNRQTDVSTNGLPGVNDILTGLLNAVGEGLSFATNYVKEENERKRVSVSASKSSARDKESSRIAAIEQMSISAVPALLPGRVNNRGPPRFTEIPFEAIPLGKNIFQ